MTTPIENLLLWRRHQQAEQKAMRAGSCWLCAKEAGMRATDQPGDKRDRIETHQECARRMHKK